MEHYTEVNLTKKTFECCFGPEAEFCTGFVVSDMQRPCSNQITTEIYHFELLLYGDSMG